MYRIQPVTGDQWTIVDERDESVFVGTLKQCEDWLDFQENASGRSQTRGGWWEWLRQFFRRSPVQQVVPPEDAELDKPGQAGPSDH